MVYYVANDINNPIIIPDGIGNIGSGREGTVYNIGGVAVKIINKNSFMTENKIETLSSVPLPKLIVMPLQPIYDGANNYSGYIMRLLNCSPAEDERLNFMYCDKLITSIDFINQDGTLLAQHRVALKDTTLRNVVISKINGLVNVVDPDRYLTDDDPKCHFTTLEEFQENNDYWINRLWNDIFYQMIEQSTNYNGSEYRKFRFYMRAQLASAMEKKQVPDFIKEEVGGFNTVEDYMVEKHQFVKKCGYLG